MRGACGERRCAMHAVTKNDLDRALVGTTDRPDAAATGTGAMAADPLEQEHETSVIPPPPGPGRPGDNPADAWTGQYPGEGSAGEKGRLTKEDAMSATGPQG